MLLKNSFLVSCLAGLLLATQPSLSAAGTGCCNRFHLFPEKIGAFDVAIGMVATLYIAGIGCMIYDLYMEQQEHKLNAHKQELETQQQFAALTQKYIQLYKWVLTNNTKALEQFIIQNYIGPNPFELFARDLERDTQFIRRTNKNLHSSYKQVITLELQSQNAHQIKLIKMIKQIWIYFYDHFGYTLLQGQQQWAEKHA